MTRPFQGFFLLALLAGLTGCESDYVETVYGRRGSQSVNGEDVLIDMFADAGHSTRVVRRRLTNGIREKANAIVWMPDSFHLPTSTEREWFDEWLTARGGRTLIVIGRDYDAGPIFWQRMLTGAPADRVPEIQRRLSEAKAAADSRRAKLPSVSECEWYRFVHGSSPAKAPPKTGPGAPPRLVGESAWTQGIDPAKLEIPLDSKLDPVFDADVVLALDGDVLVSRQKIVAHDGGTSRLVVVVNGALVTNMGLVNHEHRKLASRLVTEVKSGEQVFFVESDDEGLVLHDEPTPEDLSEMQKWPPERLRITFLHLAALAIILIVSRWPIFGRPREEPNTHESDFGRHVEALGDLLARGGNAAYATSRLEHYQKTVQGDAGKRSALRGQDK